MRDQEFMARTHSRLIFWAYALLWLAWLWVRFNVATTVNVDVPETLHYGQWLLAHGHFPHHLHWAWGGPNNQWLAVSFEAGSAIIFAVADLWSGWGLFLLWALALTLALVLTGLALKALYPERTIAWGALVATGVLTSVFEPLVAAMWVLPGVSFLLWDATQLRKGTARFSHGVSYTLVFVVWIWLSPSVILAPIFAVGLTVLWPPGEQRPLWQLRWRMFGAPILSFFLLPHHFSWGASVLRYLEGAVMPKTPWHSVTVALHPYPIGSSVSDLWIAILVAVFIRGARTKRPARLWWGLLLPLALLFLKEEYYTSLALWSLGTLWAMMGPISFSSQTGRRISVSLPIALLLIVAVIGGRLSPRMTAGQWFPQYRWFQKETHVLPVGNVWVPLAQGGVFTGATHRASWLDNRMQVWDAYPKFYNHAAQLATGRLPLGGWLKQHHVVAVFWPQKASVDQRLVQAGWHVAKWGPGHFQLWLPN